MRKFCQDVWMSGDIDVWMLIFYAKTTGLILMKHVVHQNNRKSSHVTLYPGKICGPRGIGLFLFFQTRTRAKRGRAASNTFVNTHFYLSKVYFLYVILFSIHSRTGPSSSNTSKT